MKRKALIVSAFIVYLLLGLFITHKLIRHKNQTQALYESAVQTESQSEFQKLLKQQDRPILAYGFLEAKDPITETEFSGTNFITLEIKEQRKVDDEWKTRNRQEKQSPKVLFLGKTFKTRDIDFNNNFYEKIGNGRRRTVYNGMTDCEGTLFVSFRDNQIGNMAFSECSISKAIENSGSNAGIVLFVIFWAIFGTVLFMVALSIAGE